MFKPRKLKEKFAKILYVISLICHVVWSYIKANKPLCTFTHKYMYPHIHIYVCLSLKAFKKEDSQDHDDINESCQAKTTLLERSSKDVEKSKENLEGMFARARQKKKKKMRK